jgi:PAT family beta-lactamase induction signal transducer AmpG
METAESKPASPSAPTEKQRSPWFWIPSLYFAQGIPYVVVMTMSMIMYKRMGISNTDIALYTSLLNWPWVLKPFWSPFVDIFKTKRQWIIAMQFLIAIALLVLGFSIQAMAFFVISLAIFWVMAFSSATHDIAADGFYMLGLSKHDQAWYVGIRSTFYRAAMIVGSGLLVMLAGYLETKNGLPPVEINIQATPNATVLSEVNPGVINVAAKEGELALVTDSKSVSIAPTARDKSEVDALIARAKTWNKEHGFYPREEAAAKKAEDKSWWTANITEPVAAWLKTTFPKDTAEKSATAGNIGVVYFTLSKEPPVDKQVVITFGLTGGDKSVKLVEGERFTFNSKNWNQPFMAVIQLDPKLKTESSAVFEARAGNIPLAWTITLIILAVLFVLFSIYHKFALPRPANDVPVVTGKSAGAEFFTTLGSFFQKPGIVPALLFILLYRFAEAQGVRMITPFLLDSRELGGIGLTTGQYGFVYGTVGIIALTIGGIIGGILAARYGLKKMLPIMICAIHLPNAAIVYLTMAQPDNFFVINACVAVEQFGYGFGFTAYMLYLLYFADGAHKTAHYAICTGFMALGMMVPGMWSGWLADILGYKNFFIWVMISTIPGFLVAFLVKVDPQFGRKA